MRVVVELDLTEAPPEVVPSDPVSMLRGRRRPSLRAVVDALHDAAADDRVAGLHRPGRGRMPLARAQELRAAVAEFATVKPAVAYAETFGEGDPARSPTCSRPASPRSGCSPPATSA